MSLPGVQPYAIIFGPRANCTLDICNVRYSVYGYVPSLGANASFLALFTFAGAVHAYLGWRWKTRLFTVFMILGCVNAIIGYIGRLLMYENPFYFPGFMLQISKDCGPQSMAPFDMSIVCVTSIPIYFCASIYMTLAETIEDFASELSRIPPKYFYYILIPCDLISLIVQAAGGGLSTSTSGKSQAGINLALGGLAFQVFTIVTFCGFFADFLWRYFRSERPMHRPITPRIKVFFTFLALSILLITIRCVYRLAELHEGYSGTLVRDEALYIALEGV